MLIKRLKRCSIFVRHGTNTAAERWRQGRYWQDGRPTASVDFDPLSDLPKAAQVAGWGRVKHIKTTTEVEKINMNEHDDKSI